MDSFCTGGGKLASLTSANSPAVLEQLLAAVRVGPAASTQTSRGVTGTLSGPRLSGIADSQQGAGQKSDGAHRAQGGGRSIARAPDTFHGWQLAASAAPNDLLCGTTVDGGSSGSASGSDSAALGPAATELDADGSGSGLRAAPGGLRGSGAVLEESSVKAGVSAAVAQPITRPVCGGAAPGVGSAAVTVGEDATVGRADRASLSQEGKHAGTLPAGAQQYGRTQGDKSAAGKMAAAAAAPSPPDLLLAPQPTEPVSVQLGAALPPEVAQRLKKPIRIIQPISKAWVEETLQCAGGVACGGGAIGASTAAASGAGGNGAGRSVAALPQPPAANAGRPPSAQQQAGSQQHPATQQPADFAAAASTVRAAQARPGATGASGARPSAAGKAAELPRGLTPRDMPVRFATAVAPTGVPLASGGPRQPAAAGPATGVTESSPLAALVPTLAALVGLPYTDTVPSPFTLNSLGVMPPPAAVIGSSGSGAAVALPRSYESTTTTVSASPTTAAASPFSSGFLPPRSSSGATMRGCASGDTVMAAATAGPPPLIVAATDGAAATATVASRLEALAAASPAVAALLAGMAAAPGNPVAVARSSPDVAPRSRVGAPAGLSVALQPRPLAQQPAASTAGSTSASCLGKVQGELTLLYQWYAANKAVYLDQAQRQLQRIEALTAAREDDSVTDAAAAASARAESAEAVRAFETALKIMNVCGRVEQQWLQGPQAAAALPGGGSGAVAVATATANRRTPASAPPAAALGATAAATAFPGAAIPDVNRGFASEVMARLPGACGLQLPVSVPAPSGGWAHGASAALAVAAALVGSVAREPSPVPVSVGSVPRSGAAEAAGAAGRVTKARGSSPTSVVGVSPLALHAAGARPAVGVALPLGPQGLQAAAADMRPPAVAVPVPVAQMMPPLPLRATATALPPALTPVGPITAG